MRSLISAKESLLAPSNRDGVMISICLLGCRQILLASEIMVCVGILLSFQVLVAYSVPQYVVSGLIMFVSAEVLEGN